MTFCTTTSQLFSPIDLLLSPSEDKFSSWLCWPSMLWLLWMSYTTYWISLRLSSSLRTCSRKSLHSFCSFMRASISCLSNALDSSTYSLSICCVVLRLDLNAPWVFFAYINYCRIYSSIFLALDSLGVLSAALSSELIARSFEAIEGEKRTLLS